jgi:hypothetical protein
MKAMTLLNQTEPDDVATALENLARAFEFTVVDRCPAPGCEVCGPHHPLSAAA